MTTTTDAAPWVSATLAERIAEATRRPASYNPPGPVTGELAEIPPAYRPAPSKPSTDVAVRDVPDINGDEHLKDTRALLDHFAMWSGEEALTVATLGAAAFNALDPATLEPIWEYALKILVTGDYGAGKSWQAKLIGQLVPRPVTLIEPTKPSFIDEIAEHNMVIVSELDELLSTPGRNRGLVGVMNACYEPGKYHTRKVGGKSQRIHLFGNQVLDGHSQVTDVTGVNTRALVSRAIVIQATVAPDGYRRPMWDIVAKAAAARGQLALSRWMVTEGIAGMGKSLDQVAPVPAKVGNPRRCMLFEPLLTVAQAADAWRSDHYWYELAVDSATAVEQSPEALAAAKTNAQVDQFMAGLRAARADDALIPVEG